MVDEPDVERRRHDALPSVRNLFALRSVLGDAPERVRRVVRAVLTGNHAEAGEVARRHVSDLLEPVTFVFVATEEVTNVSIGPPRVWRERC